MKNDWVITIILLVLLWSHIAPATTIYTDESTAFLIATMEREYYHTPEDIQLAISQGTEAEKDELCGYAATDIYQWERQEQATSSKWSDILALKKGRKNCLYGLLLPHLPRGYLHSRDSRFLYVMKTLIGPIEGGINPGIISDTGKRIMRPTNRGVEDQFYETFKQKRGLSIPFPVTELSEADIREMLYRELWLSYRIYKIKDVAVAALIFDGVLNSGHRAIETLMQWYIPTELIGVTEVPPTFTKAAAQLLNTVEEQGTDQEKDELLLHIFQYRRHVLETAYHFYTPELGGSLRERFHRLYRYTATHLRDSERIKKLPSDILGYETRRFFYRVLRNRRELL